MTDPVFENSYSDYERLGHHIEPVEASKLFISKLGMKYVCVEQIGVSNERELCLSQGRSQLTVNDADLETEETFCF